jgi:HK97 family phage prohead protease
MRHETKSCIILDLKADSDPGLFSGYASTYNVDLQGDRITPGAFAQSIKDKHGKVPIFANHSEDRHIGFTTALAEDGKGLAFTGELITASRSGADAYALLQKAQKLDYRMGVSIGFIPEEVDYSDDGRVLNKIDLWEVSITPFPAQPRAFVSDVKTWRDFEKYLREAEHFSRADAKRILNAFAACNQSSCGMPDGASRYGHTLRAVVARPLWEE